MLPKLFGPDPLHDPTVPSSYLPASFVRGIPRHTEYLFDRIKALDDIQSTETLCSPPGPRFSCHFDWGAHEIFWMGQSQRACRVAWCSGIEPYAVRFDWTRLEGHRIWIFDRWSIQIHSKQYDYMSAVWGVKETWRKVPRPCHLGERHRRSRT